MSYLFGLGVYAGWQLLRGWLELRQRVLDCVLETRATVHVVLEHREMRVTMEMFHIDQMAVLLVKVESSLI